jgi:hypothetical protein
MPVTERRGKIRNLEIMWSHGSAGRNYLVELDRSSCSGIYPKISIFPIIIG